MGEDTAAVEDELSDREIWESIGEWMVGEREELSRATEARPAEKTNRKK